MAVRTITLDTNEASYTDKWGDNNKIANGQTFSLNFTDTGAGGVYSGASASSSILLANGDTIYLEADPQWMRLEVDADATAKVNAGYITFIEKDGSRNQWKVRSITMADADGTGANNVTSLVMERVDNPSIALTFPETGAGITMA